MPGKCSAHGCRSGYDKKKTDKAEKERIATFHFPLNKPELLDKWKKFANMKHDPGKSAVLCEKHFKDYYIKRGKKTTLFWDKNPVPTQQTSEAQKRPACFPEMTELRKPPKIRNILPDQQTDFRNKDIYKLL